MRRGELRLPDDAPALTPARRLRFEAFWCKGFVPTVYGPSAVVQPTAADVQQWIVKDNEDAKQPEPEVELLTKIPQGPRDTIAALRDRAYRAQENAASGTKRDDFTKDGFAGFAR